MKRGNFYFFAICLTIILSMVVFLAWITSDAKAYPGGSRATGGTWGAGPNTPASNADNAGLLKDMFTGDVNPDQLSLFSASDTATGMTIAEQAGGYMPLFGITFGGLVTGIDLGLKLPAFNVGGIISYKEWKNENYTGSNYSVYNPVWLYGTSSVVNPVPGCTCTIPANVYREQFGGGTFSACNPAIYSGCTIGYWNSIQALIAQDGANITIFTNTTSTTSCEGHTTTPATPPGQCFMAYKTPIQMISSGTTTRRDGNWYNQTCIAANSCTQVDMSGSTIPTQQSLAAALAALGANDNSTHGTAQDNTMTAILNYLESHGSSTPAPSNPPGTAPTSPAYTFQPFALPKPTLTQTYQDYIDELRNKGWLGDATVSDNLAAPGWSTSTYARQNLIDGAPTSVGVGSTTALVVDSSGASVPWPTAAISTPAITTQTATVTIVKMPATFGAAVPGGSASCLTCAIDWTPIESIGYGSKFPFGIPGYINSFFGSIPTGGSCPTLNIGKPAVLGGGTLPISFCNTDWETTYRSPIFLVLEALMTLAGVVFLAQKIFGVGSSDE